MKKNRIDEKIFRDYILISMCIYNNGLYFIYTFLYYDKFKIEKSRLKCIQLATSRCDLYTSQRSVEIVNHCGNLYEGYVSGICFRFEAMPFETSSGPHTRNFLMSLSFQPLHYIHYSMYKSIYIYIH